MVPPVSISFGEISRNPIPTKFNLPTRDKIHRKTLKLLSWKLMEANYWNFNNQFIDIDRQKFNNSIHAEGWNW